MWRVVIKQVPRDGMSYDKRGRKQKAATAAATAQGQVERLH